MKKIKYIDRASITIMACIVVLVIFCGVLAWHLVDTGKNIASKETELEKLKVEKVKILYEYQDTKKW
ncbi:MAG: hypothetical protein LBE79_06415 [Tannerella sp.]|nr:hypothetical protein [Tannerella sp.]